MGGAQKVAWNLFESYRARGHESWLAVGDKLGSHGNVLPIPRIEHRGLLFRIIGDARRLINRYSGIEDFTFPRSREILELPGARPHIVHCHNLHGGGGGTYFDLRMLPWLSRQVPVILTLHDAWLLSGHCAHSLACERWKTGCGRCPDLTLYPAIQRDATAYNWRRKRDIFARSRLRVATPSRWLKNKIEQSILWAGAVDLRVIPNGVDTSVFHPADKTPIRVALDIPVEAKVLLFSAYAPRLNRWKDYQTIQAAVALVAERCRDEQIFFIALGEAGMDEQIGNARVRFVPHERDSRMIAAYGAAADVYIHAAHADTFPNAVLEALACGTPVVATAVGGIPEQIEDGRTGFLVPPGDARAMAERVVWLLLNEDLLSSMARQAARVARRDFDLTRQVDAYLDWYYELLSDRGMHYANFEELLRKLAAV
jgi:glycosyltransferase involved in cell wall biosynthesis